METLFYFIAVSVTALAAVLCKSAPHQKIAISIVANWVAGVVLYEYLQGSGIRAANAVIDAVTAAYIFANLKPPVWRVATVILGLYFLMASAHLVYWPVVGGSAYHVVLNFLFSAQLVVLGIGLGCQISHRWFDRHHSGLAGHSGHLAKGV